MKKTFVANIMVIGMIAFTLFGCGSTNENNANTADDTDKGNSVQSESSVEQDTSESVRTPEVTDTPEPVALRDGSRNAPFQVGEGDRTTFFGYGIEEYGTIDYKVVKYEGDTVTFEYTLQEYGNSNPITFNNEYDTVFYENNCVVYVYPVDDPSTFTISDTDSVLPSKKVKIGCGQTKKVNYEIGNAQYAAFVYYTLAEDGGDKDFVDKKLYGHIRFYDLQGNS